MTKIKGGLRSQHILKLALALGLTCTAASADVWVSGTVCTEGIASVGNVLDYNGGFARNPSSSTIYAVCPILVDQNVGTSQQFQMSVQDNHATQNFTSVFGLVIGTNGEILASTNSDATSGTGEDTLFFSVTTGASSDNYSYVALGNIPGGGSQIENLRVY